MPFRRALFLSSLRKRVPRRGGVARRREHRIAGARVIVPARIGLDVHRAEFPLPERVVDPLPEPPVLFLHPDLEPKLDQDDARFDEPAFELGHVLEEFLDVLLGRVFHHPFDAGAIVPAAVEDHDFASRWQMLHIALQEQLLAFVLAGRTQRNHAKCARADALGHAPDQSALARGIAAFADDDDAGAGFTNPVLQIAELDLQLFKLLLIILARELQVGLVLPPGGLFGDLRFLR